MPQINKRNGRWQAVYRDPAKRERTQTFDRRVDAERWLSQNQVDIGRNRWVDPRLGRITFKDWSRKWTATTVANRPSTRARDASYLKTHLEGPFGDRQIGSITHLEVRTWVAELSTRKAAATTQKAFQILDKIMGAAVDARLIEANPCDRVPLPKIEREEMRFLTPAEVDKLATSIKDRYRALVLVAAYGGLRIGELAGLRRGRVDVLRNRIDVAEICVEVSGHLTFGQPKTRAGRRSLTLPRSVMAALDDHLLKFTPPEPDAFVFTAPEGGPLRTPAWRRRHWTPAIEKAELSPLRPHDLRHTAVALWIASGANVLEVSRRAGHTSTSFTMDRYGHLFPEADSALADRLETMVLGAESQRQPVATVSPLQIQGDSARR